MTNVAADYHSDTMRTPPNLTILIALLLPASACTSFGTVRSAEVLPGRSVAVQASMSSRPGDVPGWFWSYECTQICDHPIVGGDAGFTYGWPRDGGAGAVALSVGVSGLLFPYLDAYAQLGGGRRPFGIGARLGFPFLSWREHQLYGRYDVPLGRSTRLLLNPAVFLHEGHAPNGQSPGTFLAFVQGVGLLLEGERVSWTPAIALVAGRAQRNSYGQQYGPVRSVFGTASIGVTFHRARSTPPN